MGLLDEIKALMSKDEPTPAPTPTPDPTPEPTPTPDPTPTPTPTPTPEPTPAPEPGPDATYSRTEVEKMLADSAAETKAAMEAIITGFKGDGAPPIGGPAQPTDTAGDFSGWNKEIKAIEDKNK